MDKKVVIITGASSGIGKALAEEFAKRGSSLVLAARRMDRLEQLQKDLSETETLIVKADVSLEDDCKNVIDQAIEKFGRIDVLINNAGISMRALFNETDLEVIRKLMEVNFWGTVYCTKFALPYLLKEKGSIIGVSSIAGIKGLPARSGYSASKFAMNGFLESLRIENLKKGLHVLVACPGFTASNIRNTALAADGREQKESPRDEQKMMTAETVADHIYHAVRARKNKLTLTAQGKMTVFLNKFFPDWLDKLVYKHLAKEADTPLDV